ncbi:BZIP domain-containing protein [Pseudozyma hubeiensis]|nr:BZIP domain-containing protein [Pseudozyma hubeiensis]
MAATQVARNSSFNGFDDIVKMPSSPTLQPRPRTISNAATISSTPVAAFNMRKVGLDENQPPPPPGSSPETFFRYYLAVELRKAGTQPSEALLDRYVRNHFDSLFKNKNGTTAASTASAAPAPSSSAASASVNTAQPQQQQPHASTSQVTVAALARPPPPQPKSTVHATASVAPATLDTASPPELDTAESPALSGRSFSPIATPPALNSIAEHDELVDFSTVFGEPSSSLLDDQSQSINSQPIKFEDDPDHMLGFFRNSPFRSTDFESATTIDPHVVQNGAAVADASAFSMPLASISPSDLSKPNVGVPQAQCMTLAPSNLSLKQDADATPMSEDGMSEDDDDDADDDRHAHRSGSKPLNTIPMAVGDINYLKPDPEEYKKLSSKEKRQLRNKISARNFRTRRKEYIGQLEDQIADRDALIEGLRQQISQLSVENKTLKDEVKTIKARTISSQDVGKILEALQTMTSTGGGAAAGAPAAFGSSGLTSGRASPTQESMPLTPGAFLNFGSGDACSSSRPATPTLAVPGSPRSQSPRPSLLRANTKKDVAPLSSFWGGVGSGVGAGSSFMPVC